ncbi:MAG: DNA translocase FtsK 4TM domain-containing protein [Desulfobulbaceae bacterium]|uniref:DNA translocase FtsK 4TM domain-containing protein n=1 Tax=Candidatus Desulfatifera sulfidica TaxID=2841691 RepID=A0A8J6N683_9BACT|nr:DNA translocase FtsK 4TM domain-containing protein [Candidatus Desulfatifera sulfidica]
MAGRQSTPTRPALKQEAVAVFGVFVASYVLLSLVASDFAAGNWGGRVGQLLAQGLFGFTGRGAYLLAALLLFFSLLFFSPRMSFERLPQITAGLTGAVIAACGLLSASSLQAWGSLDSGGFLGRTVFVLARGLIGGPGTVLFLCLLLLIALMLAVRFSPYGLANGVWCGCGSMVALFTRLVRRKQSSTIATTRAQSVKQAPVLEKVSERLPGDVVPVLKEPVQSRQLPLGDEDFALQPVARGDWRLPPLSFLDRPDEDQQQVDKEVYYQVSKQLEQKLKNFGVTGRVVGISPGPVVTTYEYAPAAGVKINKIVALADDLALGLKAQSVRVVGSVPGKAALGIEIPNPLRQIVYIRDLMVGEEYRDNKAKLSIALGLDVVGSPVVADLARMPHLLIAGATGSGKSVAINTIIASLLYNATPAEVRLLMIDPKRIELSGYEGIPHLLHPVVVEPRLAARALNWAVREMERRYLLLEEARVKSFDSYNETAEEKLPYIVIIVDELADLMMVASKDVETAIARLAQMARAAGMHLILATQRPSVDVLTGLIKANFPTRISFKVASKIDSRTILDGSGAEHLLGNGDMLFMPPGSIGLQRIHGAYISEAETDRIVQFLKEQGGEAYDESVMAEVEAEQGGQEDDASSDRDEFYDQAVALVTESGQASISMVQRRLRVGYNRAARMIEEMERQGIVGPADGAKPREILVRSSYE